MKRDLHTFDPFERSIKHFKTTPQCVICNRSRSLRLFRECSHIICESCSSVMFAINSLSCTADQVEMICPSCDKKTMVMDYNELELFLDPNATPEQCFRCGTCNNVQYCQYCQTEFCDRCFKITHSVSKMIRWHKLTPIEEKTKFCVDHNNERIIGACRTCNTLICGRCISGTHCHHDMIPPEDVFQPVVDQALVFKEDLEKKTEELRYQKESLNAECLNLRQHVNETINAYILQLERIRNQLLEKCDIFGRQSNLLDIRLQSSAVLSQWCDKVTALSKNRTAESFQIEASEIAQKQIEKIGIRKDVISRMKVDIKALDLNVEQHIEGEIHREKTSAMDQEPIIEQVEELAVPDHVPIENGLSLSTAHSDNNDSINLEAQRVEDSTISQSCQFLDGVIAWGNIDVGQIGNSNNKDDKNPAAILSLACVTVKKVSCGQDFVVFVTDDGQLYTSGDNKYGQLGHGDTNYRNIPELVRYEKGWTVHEANCSLCCHCICLATVRGESSASVFVWGNNDDNQLGLPIKQDDESSDEEDEKFEKKPQRLRFFDHKHVLHVYASGHKSEAFCCALLEKGDIYMWGTNKYGQLGLVKERIYPQPEISKLRNIKIEQMSLGQYHVLSLCDKGRVRSWGRCKYKELGYEPRSEIACNSQPRLVESLNNKGIRFIEAGRHTSAAIGKNGLYIWGRIYGYSKESENGCCGKPMLVMTDSLMPVCISIGHDHYLVSTNGGKLFASGENKEYQLGFGDQKPRRKLEQVKHFEGVQAIGAGFKLSVVCTLSE